MKKTFTGFLVVAFLLQGVSTYAFTPYSSVQLLDPVTYNIHPDAVEIPSMRTLHTATFKMPGGVHAAVSLPHGTFIENESGEIVTYSSVEPASVFTRIVQTITSFIFGTAEAASSTQTVQSYTEDNTNTSNGGFWYNVSASFADDGDNVNSGNGGESYPSRTPLLKLHNFGFSIDSGATITGIKVTLDDGYSAGGAGFDVVTMKLVDETNAVFGNNKATEDFSGGLDLGADGDMWGLSTSELTPAVVNDSDFGFAMDAQENEYGGGDMSYDTVTMTVYYTVPAPTVSMGATPVASKAYCNNVLFTNVNETTGFTLHFIWDQSVTGFASGDITVIGGTKSTFSANSGTNYTLDITDVSGGSITATVATDAVTETNSETTLVFSYTTNNGPLCDILEEDDIYWPMEDLSGDTVTDYADGTGNGGEQDASKGAGSNNITWQQVAATTATGNDYSAYFDGGAFAEYTSATWPTGDDTFYVSLWAQSSEANPTNATLLQINQSGSANMLTIAYRSDTTNSLHVSTASSIKRSDTSFDITKWNHFVIKVNSGTIDDIYLNGSSVITSETATAPAGTSEDSILIAAARNSSTVENYFTGRLDEIKIYEDVTVENGPIATFVSNNAADEQTSCYYITALPSGISATLPNASDADPTNNANKKCGTQTVRFFDTADTVPVSDAPIALNQDRSMTSGADLVIDTNVTDTDNIPSTPKAVASFHDNHGVNGAKTLYVAKGDTTTFRVCPNATDLSGVSSECTNGVSFTSGQTQSVTFSSGANDVTVSTESINSVTYWKATGMLGSGGQGEGGGGDAGGGGGDVPDLSWWAALMVLLACGYVLHKQGVLEV